MSGRAATPLRPTDLVIDRIGARFHGRRFPCAIGRGGRTREKREGDGATPIGVFSFETVYWRPDRRAHPRLSLPARRIGVHDGWSDDPEDPLYNQPVRRPHPWRCERMRRPDPLYDMVIVFDANRDPIIPGGGSALFVHVWRAPRYPTAGCIAFRKPDLLWIAERLAPESRLIVQP
ncbi:MAG: L,D-transpeptidase family protein [Pseudomonadota bacterium]